MTAAAEKGRLGGSATFSNDLGVGTFVTNDYSDDPYFAQSLRLVPTYGLTENTSAQVDWTLTWEYTEPYNANNTTNRHVTPSDVVLRLMHMSLYRDERWSGINVSGAFSAALPTSHVSRWRNNVAILTGTVALDRTFMKRLNLAYALGITKYVNTQSNRGFDSETYDYCSPTDETCPGPPGVNPNFAFKNLVMAGYQFTDKLSASIGLRFTTFLKYKVGEAGDEVNNPGFDNRHTQTWTLGDISVSYLLPEWKRIRYMVSGGIVSEQLMADSRGGGRFPFFDFETTSDNFTTFYLSATAAY